VKYVPPYGVDDADAPYVNGDPTIGQEGSIPPAEAFEHPMRELIAVIEKSGFTPSDDDLEQLAESVRSQRLNYAEDTGTADNLVVAYDPPITAYTRGLTLRVKVRNTNTGPSRINGGAGTVAIRKMNGADVGAAELPVGAIATLTYDGAVFQLSNFGGGASGGPGDVYMVNIPYTVDSSAAAGTIVADFSPPITQIQAGDIIAVKVANTAPGPTQMVINGMAPISLAPNGGGLMLQGDLHAGDVVQFFHDGQALRFIPNPDITAPVTYFVGAGQQFATIADAMATLKRKTIGASGHVYLNMTVGVFDANINVSHPSGDRITIAGTMIGPAPVWSDFAATGNSSQHMAQDAIYNINMLRTRYGTEIRTQNDQVNGYGTGLRNTGPGMVTFMDLLITGQQTPVGLSAWVFGVNCAAGYQMRCQNVSVWGCQFGMNSSGTLDLTSCFTVASVRTGLVTGGGTLTAHNGSGSFGNYEGGVFNNFGTIVMNDVHILMNGSYGLTAQNDAACQVWWSDVLGNTWDYVAYTTTSIIIVTPGNYGTVQPPLNTVGNLNSVITATYSAKP
jgi:hypothetical protein